MKYILYVTLAVLLVTLFIAIHRGLKIEKQSRQISELTEDVAKLKSAVKDYERTIKIYAEAEKQAKEFEKELNNDATDNLDVIPADYILKQLHAD